MSNRHKRRNRLRVPTIKTGSAGIFTIVLRLCSLRSTAIGTTGPGAKLDVQGGTNPAAIFNQTTANVPNIIFADTNTNTSTPKIYSGSVSMADDTFNTILSLTSGVHGSLWLMVASGANSDSMAMHSFYFQTGVADRESINLITSGGNYAFNASTTALTGTTGVDGQFTVSANGENGLQFENWLGAGKTARYFIMASN